MARQQRRAADETDEAAAEAPRRPRTEEEVLDVLDPPDDGPVIRDLSGAAHRLPPELRARRHLRATRALRPLLADSALQEVLANRDPAAIMAALLDAGTTEFGMAALGEAFGHAHPEVLVLARANCGACDSDDALELFGVAEVVEALVPFYWAVVGRILARFGVKLTAPTAA